MRLLYPAILIVVAIYQCHGSPLATTEPSWAPTGRLSQFRGFASPRPHGNIPQNAQMMFSSVWAGWSAWSFCSNGARIRVRACNTVKGFSCLGPNQETRPCERTPAPPPRPSNSDYDVVDPYEADRQEALRQLYPDDDTEEDNFVKIPKIAGGFRALSAGRTRLATPKYDLPPAPSTVNHELVGFEEHRPINHMTGAPGSDPERVFGARQFAVKTDEHKERKHKIPVPMPHQELIDMPSLGSSEEHATAFPVPVELHHTTRTTTTTTEEVPRTTPSRFTTTTTTTTAPPSTRAQLPPLRLISRETRMRAKRPKNRKTRKGRLSWLSGMTISSESRSQFAVVQPEASRRKTWRRKRNRSGHKVSGDYIAKSRHAPSAMSATTIVHNPPIHFESEKAPSIDESGDDSEFTDISIPAQPTTSTDPDDEVVDETPTVGDHPARVRPKLSDISIPVQPTTPTDPDDEVDDETPTVGDNPTRVRPKMRSSGSTENRSQESVEVVKATTTRTPERARAVDPVFADALNVPFTETIQASSQSRKKDKSGEQPEKPKKKGFGITGWNLRKASREVLHDGEVKALPVSFTATTTTTAQPIQPLPQAEPVTQRPLFEEASESELSSDTMSALDWMLRNMTKAAESEDALFLRALEKNGAEIAPDGGPTDPNSFFPLTSLDDEFEFKPEKPTKGKKTKKHRKGKKMRKTKKDDAPKLHYGEFQPVNPDPTKMFPKFRSRAVYNLRARALGVRTISADKDERTTTGQPEFLSRPELSEDPAVLMDEINKLQNLVNDMEHKMDSIASTEHSEQSYSAEPNSFKLRDDRLNDADQKADETKIAYKKKQSAMDLSLVPEGSLETHRPSIQTYDNEDSLRIVSPEHSTDARWSDWSVWGGCFCGHQLRTRNCVFGAASDGCIGSAHESRTCEGGVCPTTTPPRELPDEPQSQEAVFISPKDPRRSFRPRRLQSASSLS